MVDVGNVDFRKAFDTAPQSILLDWLSNHELSRVTLCWVKNRLGGRAARDGLCLPGNQSPAVLLSAQPWGQCCSVFWFTPWMQELIPSSKRADHTKLGRNANIHPWLRAAREADPHSQGFGDMHGDIAGSRDGPLEEALRVFGCSKDTIWMEPYEPYESVAGMKSWKMRSRECGEDASAPALAPSAPLRAVTASHRPPTLNSSAGSKASRPLPSASHPSVNQRAAKTFSMP